MCAWSGAPFLNKRAAEEGFGYQDMRALVQSMDPDWRPPSKPTWYAHKKHITAPIVTATQEAKRNPVIVPQSSVGALEMIRNLGMRNAVENPETVTVDHALKAATELERSKGSSGGVVMILAKMLAARDETPAIETAWTEVPALTTEEETLAEE